MNEVVVNGTARRIAAGETIAQLLRDLDLDPRWVVAELNGEPMPRDRFATARLTHGDRLELVRPVAGG